MALMKTIPFSKDVPARNRALKIIEIAGLDCTREKRFGDGHHYMPGINVVEIEFSQFFGKRIVVLFDTGKPPLARAERRRRYRSHAILPLARQRNEILRRVPRHDALKPLIIIRDHRLIDDGITQTHGQIVSQASQSQLLDYPGTAVDQHGVNCVALSGTRHYQ